LVSGADGGENGAEDGATWCEPSGIDNSAHGSLAFGRPHGPVAVGDFSLNHGRSKRPLMAMVSKVAAPVVWLLDASTKLVFRLLGKSAASDSAVTEEEIRKVVAEAETAGVIETDERKMISGVLRLGDKAVRGIMTPRTEVDWIDLADSESEIRECLIKTNHSRLPVAEGTPDNLMGIVQARELLAASLSGEHFNIRA
jgi:putative hemolysin